MPSTLQFQYFAITKSRIKYFQAAVLSKVGITFLRLHKAAMFVVPSNVVPHKVLTSQITYLCFILENTMGCHTLRKSAISFMRYSIKKMDIVFMGCVIFGTRSYCSRHAPTLAAVTGLARVACVADKQLMTQPFANVALCSGKLPHQSHCNAHARVKYS